MSVYMDSRNTEYHQYIAGLIGKYQRGEATEAELREIELWYESADAMVRNDLTDGMSRGEKAKLRGKLLHGIAEGLQSERGIVLQQPRRPAFRWLPYAAAVAILLSVGWLLLVDSRQSSVDSLADADVAPGGNRATLTLADGRVINLDEAQTGIIVGAEDITYQDGVSLGLSPAGGARDGQSDGRGRLVDIEELTLTTPKGGTYQITLPDGSRVWLNSASTLRYPSRFSGKERIVELSGEAFFEIQEIQGARVSRVPFKVLTSGQTVEVLGTEFNISAYADEKETKTTLVTGKVRVGVSPAGEPVPIRREGRDGVHDGRGRYLELKPGQQATTRARLPGQGAATTINSVDVNNYTSWKDGLFDFTGMTLPEVMRQLERWYDIEVVWEGHVPDTRYLGQIYRDNNLSQVLKILESAQVRFTIQEGRKLIIH